MLQLTLAADDRLQACLNGLKIVESRCQRVQHGQERCSALIDHCRTLISEAIGQLGRGSTSAQAVNLVSIERAYAVVDDYVSILSARSLAWLLLNQDSQSKAIQVAELALVDVYTSNKMDSKGLHVDLQEAARQDSHKLVARLAETDENSDIMGILQANESPQRSPKELFAAFSKASQALGPAAADEIAEARVIRTATRALERLLDRSSNYEIPSWCLTSFEVDFDSKTSLIGRGAYGHIVKGRWKGQDVAVKEMSSRMSDDKAIEAIQREIHIWSRLSHPNILPFFGACLEASKPFIVSQLCKHGTALNYLQAFPHVDRARLLLDVAVGMKYLHMQGVIHADLKASNILVRDSGEALITDFGLSQVQDQVSSSINITRISAESVGGTLRWMSPEVLEGQGLNKPADVYGFALTAWEFYSGGAIPFGNVDDNALFRALIKAGERPERPALIEDSVWKIVQECWASDPHERPDFGAVERMLMTFIKQRETGNKSGNDNFDGSSKPEGPNIYVDGTRTKTQRGKDRSPSHQKTKPDLAVATGSSQSFLKGLVTSLFKSPRSAASPKSPNTPKHPDPHHTNALSDEAIITCVQSLPSLSPVMLESPTSEFHQMNVTLSFLYNVSLTLDGVSEVLAEGNIVPALIARLFRSEVPQSERYLTLGFLANLACRASARKVLLLQRDLMYILTISLASTHTLSVQEHASRCLYNLSTTGDSHDIIIKESGLLTGLAHILRNQVSANHVTNALGCLTNLSHKLTGRSALLSTPDVASTLICMIQTDASSRAKEQALICLGNLSVDDQGVNVLTSQSQLITSLAACLVPKPTGPITSQTLRCLRNMATTPVNHEGILREVDIMSTVNNVLSSRVSSAQQKYALHLVNHLSSSDSGRQWILGDMRCMSNLKWFADNGYVEEKGYATGSLRAVVGNVESISC